MKKLLALLLALCLLLPAGLAAAETVFPLSEEKITFRIATWQRSGQVDYNDMLMWQKYEEMTNVHIDWIHLPDSTFVERRNAMFTQDDLPDAIYRAKFSLSDVNKYAAEEMLLPLDDLVDNYAPNLQKFFAEYPQVRKALTMEDGHLYSLGYFNICDGLTVYTRQFLNMDWMNRLNLQVPTTIDEFTDVLRAFRDGGDLNGDGEANEIPFTISDLESVNFGSRLFLGSFGVYDSIDSYLALDGEGHVVYNPVQEGYRKYLNWMNTLYSENLLDSEAFTHDFAGFKAKTRLTENEIVGLQVCWSLDTIGNDNYTMLLPVTGPDGDRMISANSTYNKLGTSNYNCFEITIANPDPAATMRWLDELYSDEYGIQAYYGAYDSALGVNEDGTIYQLDPPEGYTLNSWCWTVGMNDNFVGYVSKAIEDKLVFNDVYSTTGRSKLDDDARYLPYTDESRNFPNVTLTESENEEIALLKTDIDSIRSEYAARWVVEGGIDDQWDAYVAQLNDAGLSRYLEIYQAAYDRLNG